MTNCDDLGGMAGAKTKVKVVFVLIPNPSRDLILTPRAASTYLSVVPAGFDLRYTIK